MIMISRPVDSRQSDAAGAVTQPVGMVHRLAEATRRYLPELVVTGLLFLGFGVSSLLSPFFLDAQFLYREALLYVEIGLLAIVLTPIFISGNLDLSVASNLAMVACTTAYLHAKLGVDMGLSIGLGVALGVLAGAFNALVIVRIGLPSLVVTLGTMALYRGVAQILVGDWSIQDFPQWFIGIDRVTLPGIGIPLPIIILLIVAILFGLMMHKTVFGRWVYAVGTNEEAARFSGVPVRRVKFVLFVLAGLFSAIAGLMLDSRLAVARYDHARGAELEAITALVLGGTSMAGGRGTIYGTLVAVFLVGVLRTGMGVANIKVESQLAVVGTLLVASVVASNALARVGRGR